MTGPLRRTTYTSPAKPIPATPGWGQQATWPATTVTLVQAGADAVLLDALMTRAEGALLDDRITGQGVRDLTAVYVTHGHADHFFGATELLRRRPAASLRCRPRVRGPAAEQTTPAAMALWTSFFPDQLNEDPRVPDGLDEPLTVGGHALVTLDLGQSDVADSTVVHILDLDTVVCGDVVYNGVHLWLAGSTIATRSAWLDTLDAVERLGASTIVSGHRDPGAVDDDAGRILHASRQYLVDFEEAVASGDSSDDIVRQMLEKHGDLANPYTLWLGAQGQRPE